MFRLSRALLPARVCVSLALCLAPVLLFADILDGQPVTPQSDHTPLYDPFRPVMEIGPDYFVVQWTTATPTPTRLQIRQSDLPMTVWRPAGEKTDLWAQNNVRMVEGDGTLRTHHVLRVAGLQSGKRYFYRHFLPGVPPTPAESRWGASGNWGREWAVSTQGGKSRKTVIRLPVKVLLMPNVVNIASARKTNGTYVPLPPAMREADLAKIRAEYAQTSRFLFLNSGLRYYPDFQIFVDNRVQRWGDEPNDAPPEYKGLPICRSYAGKDFDPPGGGAFTIVDTQNVERVTDKPVREEHPYPGQVEQAFVQRYNDKTGAWEFYQSGGGTYGPDSFPDGVPARSQFLGGGDTAWLAAHEFHHQMEGQSAFSLANREDDRIVFDHPSPRSPTNPWNTSGRHGEHWDVLAYWDRTLTGAQWLRSYFGETLTVLDEDGDGVPDEDSRLPIDEKRLGSDKRKFATDGQLSDLQKAMLTTLAPSPLQPTWKKRAVVTVAPNFRRPDSDGDGINDGQDPYPLIAFAPFIYPLTAQVDGQATEWASVPLAGSVTQNQVTATFQQAHDDDFYYGLVRVKGPWKSFRLVLDGEGRGVFSGQGVHGIRFTWAKDTPVLGNDFAPPRGFVGVPRREADGTTVLEFSLPNRGEGDWFWDKAGREIGSVLEVTGEDGAVYALHEGYRPFYARMLPFIGRAPLPPGAPAELTSETATRTLLPGSDNTIQLLGEGWQRNGDRLKHSGPNEALAYFAVPTTVEFDLWMRFEGKQDGILGAFVEGTGDNALGAGRDYIAFVGGYANTVSKLRVFGDEKGESDTRLTPGEHTLQLSRRNGGIWCLFDGKPILYARDPDPKKLVNRLAVIGGYTGEQVIKEVRIRQ